ncbi:ATP-grasp domain-containing protein [Ktedonosporobacter rubrisoli]|uniref:ATP-grasp domain-containing protein n=1 Tax=Ktedonosporobacter rubrisoli TaxID=2509675 RepID=A0A4P6JNA3_KTERU|nr:ATP-grasp domain-containing protein [Ktedonosporobacter rubrisoli]QBD76787.1 ATP-grasp domain-containing protein [Ktedonosporobacter rubrisoli]
MSQSLTVLSIGGVKKKGALFLQQAQMRGLRVWMLDTEQNLAQAPAVVAKADRVTALPFRDLTVCQEWARMQQEESSLLGVFPLSEYAVEAAAVIAQALHLPGNAPEVMSVVRHKDRCRQVLRELGFPQPSSALCKNLAEAQDFAASHAPGPWIIKPPAEGGSIGVSLVRTTADWEPALRHLLQFPQTESGTRNTQHLTLPSPFLVECFQQGQEFSVEGAFVAGKPQVLAITHKITTQAPHFIEIGHTMPADLPSNLSQHIRQTVVNALLAVGMRWGLFHVECWVNGDQVVLGEIHGRSGGDNIHLMTELVTGLDMFGLALDDLLDTSSINPESWQLTRQGAAMRYFSAAPGRVTAIYGLSEAAADPACVKAFCTLRVGDESSYIASSLDRHGYVLATGATASTAAATAERLRQQISIEVEALTTCEVA